MSRLDGRHEDIDCDFQTSITFVTRWDPKQNLSRSRGDMGHFLEPIVVRTTRKHLNSDVHIGQKMVGNRGFRLISDHPKSVRNLSSENFFGRKLVGNFRLIYASEISSKKGMKLVGN